MKMKCLKTSVYSKFTAIPARLPNHKGTLAINEHLKKNRLRQDSENLVMQVFKAGHEFNLSLIFQKILRIGAHVLTYNDSEISSASFPSYKGSYNFCPLETESFSDEQCLSLP